MVMSGIGVEIELRLTLSAKQIQKIRYHCYLGLATFPYAR
jgi:hypothetical protein